MLNRKKTRASKYETPRLHTYGKLQDLTKGTSASGADNGSFKDGTT